MLYNEYNEKAYRESHFVNQSTLKKMTSLEEAKKTLDGNFEPSVAMTLGSIADILITSPDFKKKLNQDYFFLEEEIKAPSEKMVKMLEYLLSVSVDGETLTELNFHFQDASQYAEYFVGKFTPNRIKTFVGKSFDYFEFMKKTKGKIIVEKHIYNLAEKIKDTFFIWKGIIVNEFAKFEANKRFDLHLQPTVLDTDREEKGMFDFLIVDHKTQRVMIKDLKTTYSINNIEQTITSLRMDIQAAWYKRLYLNNAKMFNAVKTDGTPYDFAGYELLFIETSKSDTMYQQRVRVSLDDQAIYIGKYGYSVERSINIDGVRSKKSYQAKLGFSQLHENYKWFKETNYQKSLALRNNPEANFTFDFFNLKTKK